MADITKPKRRVGPGAAAAGTPAADPAPHLVIPKRPIIIPITGSGPAEPTSAAGAESVSPAPKTAAKAMQPPSAASGAAAPLRRISHAVAADIQHDAAPETKPSAPKEMNVVPADAAPATGGPAISGARRLSSAPSPTKPAAVTDSAASKPQAAENDSTAAGGPSATAGPEDNKEPETKDDKTNPQIRKALEDARREQEIQSYIDNREFFVPINAVARKKSLKVSAGLVILELLLGAVLIDLMLDAGVIELLQKVPHTHLFNLH